jgi:modification methylase
MKLGPYELNSIITGDARELARAIPDNSVDLIFTDPVYDRIEDYEWLAETAARVLKDDRACLVWTSTPLMSKVMKVMEPPLDYAWMLYWQRTGPCFPGKTGICVICQCLWLQKGQSKTYKKIADWIHCANGQGTKDNSHKWAKPYKVLCKWLEAFTQTDDIIFDPFTGGGTVPAVCKQLTRQYLAFEIDPATADIARQRVASTQPPLPIVYPEQMELSYDHP